MKQLTPEVALGADLQRLVTRLHDPPPEVGVRDHDVLERRLPEALPAGARHQVVLIGDLGSGGLRRHVQARGSSRDEVGEDGIVGQDLACPQGEQEPFDLAILVEEALDLRQGLAPRLGDAPVGEQKPARNARQDEGQRQRRHQNPFPQPALSQHRLRSVHASLLSELRRQLGGRRMAGGRVLAQAAEDQLLQRPRQVAPELSERRGIGGQHRGLHGRRRTAGERPRPRQHLVEDGAQREQIGPDVDGAACGLLRRHVGGSPQDSPRSGEERRGELRRGGGRPARLAQLGESEVEDLRPAVGGDHDVGGLEIAMDHAAVVRRRDAFHQPAGQLVELRQLQPRLRDRLVEPPALHQLHGQEVDRGGSLGRSDLGGRHRILGLLDRVDGDDVGVVERGDRLRLAPEPLTALGVGRDLRGKNL